MKKHLLLFLLLGFTASLSAAIPSSLGPKALTGSATVTTNGPVLGPIDIQDQMAVTVQVSSITGTAGLQLQGTVDGTNWVTMYTTKVGASSFSLTMTANGLYEANLAGLKKVRVTSIYVTSGTNSVTMGLGRGPASTQLRLTTAATPTP